MNSLLWEDETHTCHRYKFIRKKKQIKLNKPTPDWFVFLECTQNENKTWFRILKKVSHWHSPISVTLIFPDKKNHSEVKLNPNRDEFFLHLNPSAMYCLKKLARAAVFFLFFFVFLILTTDASLSSIPAIKTKAQSLVRHYSCIPQIMCNLFFWFIYLSVCIWLSCGFLSCQEQWCLWRLEALGADTQRSED